jgi:hypothetical protein
MTKLLERLAPAFLFTGLFFFFIPVGRVIGWVDILPFSSWARVGDLFFIFLAYLGFLYFLIWWPLERANFIVSRGSKWRVLQSTVLLSLPLLSFAYYQSHMRDTSQWIEITSAIVPGVLALCVFYWRTGDAVPGFTALALTSFISIFCLSDLLGPFSTLISFTMRGYTVWYLRGAFVIVATASIFICPVSKHKNEEEEEPVIARSKATKQSH